jgi:hypothetical protein
MELNDVLSFLLELAIPMVCFVLFSYVFARAVIWIVPDAEQTIMFAPNDDDTLEFGFRPSARLRLWWARVRGWFNGL